MNPLRFFPLLILCLAPFTGQSDIVHQRFPRKYISYFCTNELGEIEEKISPLLDGGLQVDSPWFTFDFSSSTFHKRFTSFDPNLDGTADFIFKTGSAGFSIIPTNGAAVWTTPAGPRDVNTLALPLNAGDTVGPDGPDDAFPGDFWDEDEIYGAGFCASFSPGLMAGLFCGEAYAGLRFQIGTNTHYGWIHLVTLPVFNAGTVLAFAYEDEPDTPITIIPEPSTFALLVFGALLLFFTRRSHQQKRS